MMVLCIDGIPSDEELSLIYQSLEKEGQPKPTVIFILNELK